MDQSAKVIRMRERGIMEESEWETNLMFMQRVSGDGMKKYGHECTNEFDKIERMKTDNSAEKGSSDHHQH